MCGEVRSIASKREYERRLVGETSDGPMMNDASGVFLFMLSKNWSNYDVCFLRVLFEIHRFSSMSVQTCAYNQYVSKRSETGQFENIE